MPSTNTLGKYQILREIARSNDIVYEAVDPSLGRHVALKELNLPPNLTGAQKRERIERFLREGKAAGQLAHPNIVTIYDVGQENDRFYIAMEYLQGQTLRETLQMRGALPVKDAIDITLQLCSALSYAHQNNIVHRDVKPENVQILPGGYVKLTDFGIARIMSEPSITANGQVFGTPSYMSPEQVSGRNIDGRSDIFALGVMLYEMLAGHKPFSGDTVVTITYNIMNSEPPPPPGVPPYLVGIIRKAMAKDQNMRYSNVEQLIADLKQDPPPNGGMIYGDPYSVNPSPGYSPTYGGPPPTTYAPPPNAGAGGGYQPQPNYQQDPFAGTPLGGGNGGQHVPDPFAQAPAAPPGQSYQDPMVVPIPKGPLISPETKTFLGTLFVVIAVIGMLIFAVWTVNEAYSAYANQAALEVSQKYIRQGDNLLSEGKISAALDQYNNAVRAASSSKKAADQAKRKLATVYAQMASDAVAANNYSSAAQYGQQAVQSDPNYSAGHYFYGVGCHYTGNREQAEKEYRAALETGGNDSFAITSRQLLSKLYIENGDALSRAGRADEGKTAYQQAADLQDPEWGPIAQGRLNGQPPQ